jgi:RNA polymerase sigma factor (sigma-70 family)
MSVVSSGVVLGHVDHLFRDGTVTGLGEAQLLERYATRRDEAAFAALLERHGPLVLGVCRRWLRDPHDVNDAFQATFLVLVQRARAIRDGDRLGPWLYGVAFRVASRLRSQVLRRSEIERRGARETMNASTESTDLPELRLELDQELARLPQSLRSVVVMCDLQDIDYEDAAHRLGLPVGTIKSRLFRARTRLRDRLVQRGWGPLAGLLGTAALGTQARASVPACLFESTVRAASEFATHKTVAAGLASASAVALAKEILRTIVMAKWNLTAACGLTAALLVSAGAWGFSRQEAGGNRGQGAVSAAGLPQDPNVFDARRRASSSKRASSESVLEAETPPSAVARDVEPVRARPEELAIRLAQAQRRVKSLQRNVNQGLVSNGQLEDAKDVVRLIEAQIESLRSELQDELELLTAQRQLRLAELEAASVFSDDAAKEAALVRRMHETATISATEAGKAETNAHSARSLLMIRKASVGEIEVRISQAKRRLDRIKAIPQAPEAPTEKTEPAEKVPPARPDSTPTKPGS